MDLYATILTAAGAELPSDRPLDGNDLLPFLKGESPSPTNRFFYFNHEALEGLREGRWKLRWTRNSAEDSMKVELFDLESDPGEMYDRKTGRPEIVERFQQTMKEFAAEIGATVAADQ